jgi:tetratricopeptide (TPR) repeat protein
MNESSWRAALREESVEKALEAMRLGRDLRDHPLRFFLSVLNRILSPHVLSGDVAVQVTIFEYLAQLITDHLRQVRQLHQLDSPSRHYSEQELQRDFQQGNAELEAWSVLYHRYVCVERNLSMQQIADSVSQDQRTLRRRQQLGVRRLTLLLVRVEQGAWQQNIQQRQRLALPRSQSPRLVGATSLLETTQHLLTEIEQPCHVVLHGPAGIGKTAAALAVAHALVDSSRFDDVLWLDVSTVSPMESLTLTQEISSRLGLFLPGNISPAQTLRAYLLTHHLLVVLDAAEHLFDDPREAKRALDLLASASILITSRARAPLYLECHQLAVPELSQERAFELLERKVTQSGYRGSAEDFGAIWEAAGGNPMALQCALEATRSLPLSVALSRAPMGEIYREIWEQLPPDMRRVWLLPLMFSRGSMSLEASLLLTDLDESALFYALASLVDRALISLERERGFLIYHLQPVALTFLVVQVRHGAMTSANETAADFLSSALSRRVTQLAAVHDPEAAARVIELSRQIGLSIEARWQYAYALAPQLLSAGLWRFWSEELKDLLRAEAQMPPARVGWLNLMLGVATRWMGQLDDAQAYLAQAKSRFGAGSVEMADVLVEASVTLRYQGVLDEAYRCAEEALGIYEQYEVPDGIERCVHELSQLSLEADLPDRALATLDRLDRWSVRTWGIASQAYLGLRQIDDARRAASHLVALLSVEEGPNRGRALATLGQVYQELGEAREAVEYLSLAIDLLDQDKDLIGYGRACNNLAVAVLRDRSNQREVSPEKVRHLLTRALRIQEQVGDEVGMAVTEQNLRWLSS